MEALCKQCGFRFCYEMSDAECPKCGSLALALQGDEQPIATQAEAEPDRLTKPILSKTLQSCQFLEDLPLHYIQKIVAISRQKDCVHGEVIFNEGEDASVMYLIVSGAVSLKIDEGNGTLREIVTLRVGDLLGWSSLTNNHQYAATAVVDGPTRLVELDGRQMQICCSDDPKFGYEIMRRTIQALSTRLIATWTQLARIPHTESISSGVTTASI